jgi:tight adherence protein C
MFIMVIAIVLTVLAVFVLLVGLRRPDRAILIEERLVQFGNRIPSLEEVELQQPFQDRVIVPMLKGLTSRIGRFAPGQNSARLRQQLMEAGAPKGLGPTEFTGLRIVIGGGLPASRCCW